MPASFTIGPHFLISDWSKAAASAGVVVTMGAPIDPYL
jgi:hypothetical protein